MIQKPSHLPFLLSVLSLSFLPFPAQLPAATNIAWTAASVSVNTNGILLAPSNLGYPLVTLASDPSGVTNFVLNFARSDLNILTSTNINLIQSTNRLAAVTNTTLTRLRILASGVDVIVTKNTSWKTIVTTDTWPLTITNGDWALIHAWNFGDNETNVIIHASYAH